MSRAKKIVKSYFIILPFILLMSCKPIDKKVVYADVNNFLSPVGVSVNPGLDLGEMEISSDPKEITMIVTNNSDGEFTNLSLDVFTGQNYLKFQATTSGVRKSPGAGGSCGTILKSKASCSYKLSFIPFKLGQISIPVTINYYNYIKAGTPHTVTFTGLIGEPADLAFSNGFTSYNLGNVEQTNSTVKKLFLEIVNNGELTARDITPAIVNINASGAYSIVSNGCPKSLRGKAKCTIEVGYAPVNNSPTDLPATYNSNFSIDYLKTPNNLLGKLNSTFTFYSTRLEADFTPSVVKSLGFSTLVVGNSEIIELKIQNIGYEAGVVKALLIGSDIECIKAVSGNTLACKKSGVPTTLANFPFIIQDTNNCFERNVIGVVAKAAGEICSLQIKYQPSVTHVTGNTFPVSDIYLKYDSRWKGVSGTIISKKIANIPSLTALGVGLLAFDHVELTPPGLTKLPNIIPDVGAYLEANLGSIPLFQANVDTNGTFYLVKLFFKNVGNSSVKVKKITVGMTAPLEIIPGVSAALSSGFYLKVIQSSCETVPVSSNCIVTFNLAPKPQASTIIENAMMFDFIDSMMPSLNYKLFKLTYSSGPTVNDTGAAVPDKEIEIRLKSLLVRRGVLVIESPNSIRYSGIAGQTQEYKIYLRNIGTGNLLLTSGLNQMFNPPAGAGNDWTWRLIANSGDSDTCGIYNSVDKTLAPDEVCSVAVKTEVPETSRLTNFGYFNDYVRGFTNQGERITTAGSSIDINFRYHGNPLDLVSITETNSIKLSSSYIAEAHIVPQKPLPSTSAILYRPEINYSTVSVTYPGAITKNATVVPELYYDSRTFAYTYSSGNINPGAGCPGYIDAYTYEQCYNHFFKSHLSVHHFQTISNGSMPRTGGEYIFHAGTFPTGEEANFGLSFINSGVVGASSMIMVEEVDASSPISIKSILPPGLSYGAATPQIKFGFNTNTPGLYSRCYDLNYYSGLSNRTTRVCIYAEAVARNLIGGKTKLIDIGHSDNNTTYTNITSNLNSFDDSEFASFFVINGSNLTVKKRFKISNNRNVSVNMMSYYILESPTSTPKNITGQLSSPYISMRDANSSPAINLAGDPNPACSVGMTLAAGSSCVVDIIYAPTDIEGQTRDYLGVVFEIAPNQYVSYTGALSFRSAPPTKLSVVNVTFQDPISPTPTDIYAVTALSGTKALRLGSSAISLNRDPSNPKKYPYALTSATISNIFEYRVVNASTLKTSFMSAWTAHQTKIGSSDPFPVSDTEITIFTSDTAEISANRACFFGDDEGNSGIPASFKGFNRDTQNICRMKLAFKGYRTFSGSACDTQSMGGLISNSCNPFAYTLLYSTTDGVSLVNDDLNLHMQGYIEPNSITSDTFQLTDIVAKSNGSVKIAVPTINANHLNRGSVTVGLLCYDKDFMKLKSDKIYNLINDYTYINGNLSKIGTTADIENCVAFTDNDQYVNVGGLSSGSYYFFKVFAMRNFPIQNAGEQELKYISNSSVMILTAAIPGANQIYNHATKQFIDTSIKSQTGTRDFAMSTCAADFTNFDILGVKYKAYKSLINTPIFNYLIANPSSNANYPNEGIGAITHWLSDSAYDIGSSISLYDGTSVPGFSNYNVTALDGTDENLKASYHQTCSNNSSCSLLYKLVGGDPGDGLYFEGVFYTTPVGANAAIRCYRELLCPTNPTLSINSASCLQP
jgi:hypothetical protein